MLPYRPSYEELLDACALYVQQEQGDTNYQVAYEWVNLHWDSPLRVAGGIRILQETWNRAFYTRGIFDIGQLVRAIDQHFSDLCELRLRQVDTFSTADEGLTGRLWRALFEALRPRGRQVSPYVATAKTLHLLSPSFFVPFDAAIAKKYHCNIDQPRGYIKFQHHMADLACYVLDTFTAKHGGNHDTARGTICGRLYLERTGSQYTKPFAKLLDEYNWIKRKE